MNLESQVCKLENAKKLKELGVSQESYFSWFGDETHRLLDNCAKGIEYGPWLFLSNTKPINNMQEDSRELTVTVTPIAAAFTVSELSRMFGVGTKASDEKLFDAVNERISQGLSFVVSAYDVEFLATKMIELIKSGVLLVEDCNVRLIKK